MAKPMTKTQLVAALAEAMAADEKSAAGALSAITNIITREVAGGGAVTLPGVGKIYCRERPERMVRNPASGEVIRRDADKVVKMTIAKALKESVNDTEIVYAPPKGFGSASRQHEAESQSALVDIKDIDSDPTALLTGQSEVSANEYSRKEIQDFLRVLSHEVMMPLVDIHNLVAKTERFPEAFPASKTLPLIKNSVQLALALVEGMSFATENSSETIVPLQVPTEVELVFENLKNSLRPMCQDYDFSMENIRLTGGVKQVFIQRSHLTAILLNAIANSIKYSDRGSDGWINVDLSLSQLSQNSSAQSKRKDEKVPSLIIRVSDNGSGIDETVIPHLFEQGFRGPSHHNHVKGSGLGLALIKHLVERMGGTVKMSSTGRPDRDTSATTTTLRVDLPNRWVVK